MKRFLLLLLLALLPFIIIFSTPDLFYTQDGWTHLARGGAFYKALTDGQFPVRWAGDLNYGYGMPLFNFVFQFPYLIMSIFIFFGFGLVTSLKIITLVSFIFSGVFMFLFARNFFKTEEEAWIVTIFYQFFPYHLVDMLVRGSIGEVYTFTFFPLVLYGIVLCFKKTSLRGMISITLGTAGLLLTHLALGGVFLAISIFFILVFVPKIKKSIGIFFSMGLGIGLSAYYWLPAFHDHQYTYGSFFAKDLYASHFVPFFHFFTPNFLNNPALRTGDVPIQVGVFHTFIIVLALIILFKRTLVNTKEKKIIFFCLFLIIGSFFIMQPVSLFIWQTVPLIEQFQFPWRFLGLVGFATSLLAFCFYKIRFFRKKAVFITFFVLVIVSTMYYWYPQLGFKKINESDYWNYPLDTTYFGETNLIWSAGPASSFPEKNVEVISGDASVRNIQKKSTIHKYIIHAKTASTIIDHTQFFPGWKVFVDGEDVPIEFQNPSYPGLIIFHVSEGKHEVKVLFTETKIRLLADIISLVSVILFLVVLVIVRMKRRHT